MEITKHDEVNSNEWVGKLKAGVLIDVSYSPNFVGIFIYNCIPFNVLLENVEHSDECRHDDCNEDDEVSKIRDCFQNELDEIRGWVEETQPIEHLDPE